jgi:DNA-binding transcriptional LysR family regulator
MRHFEERLGFRLLNRTTRSVSLTDAGLRLLDWLRPAVEQISRGLEDLKGEQGHPFGHLRLYMTHLAGAAVIAPVWARFLSTFPDVQLEVHADAAPGDIVAKGFDAGIGPKDWAAADMIAVRVMGPMKVAVVGPPTYFARRHPPHTPDDLARHSCVQYRRAADGVMFEWPFERDGKSRLISVDGRIIVNDSDLAVRAAVDGLGIAYTIEALADPFLRSGQLVRVLEDWSPSVDGLFLYYPGHRQVPVAFARPHRHAPQHSWVGAGQRLARAPLRRRVNAPRRSTRSVGLSSLTLLYTATIRYLDSRRSGASPGCRRLPAFERETRSALSLGIIDCEASAAADDASAPRKTS